MEEIRCGKCNKKLAEVDYRRLAIKCPRCGEMNHLKAIEPPDPAPGVQKESHDERDP